MADDPYSVLGVPREASEAAIKAAYRKLARQNHPDLNPGKPEAEARFKAAASAHDLLSDPDKKARFDRGEIDAEGQERRPAGGYRRHAEAAQGDRYSPGVDPGTFEDLFADLFEARARSGPFDAAQGPRRGEDEAYRLDVDFTAAVLGATERLTLPDGRELSVRIPPGLVTGQVLRLRGQGGPGRQGAPAGDAMIEVRVADHPLWRRDGRDVVMELPVSVPEAVLGGPVEVPTPGGRLRVTLPKPSDSGRQIRLRGKGVAGAPAGDLIVTLRVVIGPPDAALEDFMRGWQPETPSDPRAGLEGAP